MKVIRLADYRKQRGVVTFLQEIKRQESAPDRVKVISALLRSCEIKLDKLKQGLTGELIQSNVLEVPNFRRPHEGR